MIVWIVAGSVALTLVFLFTYQPMGAQFASETLTDSFFNTAKFLITYYDIPPDRLSAPPAPTL